MSTLFADPSSPGELLAAAAASENSPAVLLARAEAAEAAARALAVALRAEQSRSAASQPGADRRWLWTDQLSKVAVEVDTLRGDIEGLKRELEGEKDASAAARAEADALRRQLAQAGAAVAARAAATGGEAAAARAALRASREEACEEACRTAEWATLAATADARAAAADAAAEGFRREAGRSAAAARDAEHRAAASEARADDACAAAAEAEAGRDHAVAGVSRWHAASEALAASALARLEPHKLLRTLLEDVDALGGALPGATRAAVAPPHPNPLLRPRPGEPTPQQLEWFSSLLARMRVFSTAPPGCLSSLAGSARVSHAPPGHEPPPLPADPRARAIPLSGVAAWVDPSSGAMRGVRIPGDELDATVALAPSPPHCATLAVTPCCLFLLLPTSELRRAWRLCPAGAVEAEAAAGAAEAAEAGAREQERAEGGANDGASPPSTSSRDDSAGGGGGWEEGGVGGATQTELAPPPRRAAGFTRGVSDASLASACAVVNAAHAALLRAAAGEAAREEEAAARSAQARHTGAAEQVSHIDTLLQAVPAVPHDDTTNGNT